MKQTMLLKLVPTQEQARALLDTMHAFNAACDYIAEQAYAAQVANKFELQKMTYGTLRATYHLPAQVAIRAISYAGNADWNAAINISRADVMRPLVEPESSRNNRLLGERLLQTAGFPTLAVHDSMLSIIVSYSRMHRGTSLHRIMYRYK